MLSGGIFDAIDGYCSVNDVEGETKIEYTDSSKPTENDVRQYIARGYNEINIILKSLDYPTPIDRDDDSESFSYVRDMNMLFAAARASLKPGSGDTYKIYMDQWKYKVKDMKDGILIKLHDAEPGGGSPRDHSDYTGPEIVGRSEAQKRSDAFDTSMQF